MTFNLGNGIDILNISECMMLTPEEVRYIDLLKVGEAIVKLKGRVFKPLLVKLPYVPIMKGKITDSILRTRAKKSFVGYPPKGVKDGRVSDDDPGENGRDGANGGGLGWS